MVFEKNEYSARFIIVNDPHEMSFFISNVIVILATWTIHVNYQQSACMKNAVANTTKLMSIVEIILVGNNTTCGPLLHGTCFI